MFDKGEECDILCHDYSNPFDSVPHKLAAMGITGKIDHWIGSFVHSMPQRVVVEGVCSSWSHVKSGVPQVSVLGPDHLWNYINDLP